MRRWLAVALRSVRLIHFDLLARTVAWHPSAAEIGSGEVLVVESDGVRKWACLKCPGGCSVKIALSLNPSRRPRWRIERDWLGRPTVEPSIHQLNACGCHFWIRRGHVVWCRGGRPETRGRMG